MDIKLNDYGKMYKILKTKIFVVNDDKQILICNIRSSNY